jgi:membrane peptidoglycan carboxypeptidase
MVIISNVTGDIVAMAGGVGEKTVHDGLNRATDSKL